ncbi:MAG: hypothetical protein KDK37_04435 [Leptospiraceae bacterium]|nr:hypothetical protein [Leptospiraceae bacterium]MCB1303495.1 hypothetical protein [Leptospiraceae bacterium]
MLDFLKKVAGFSPSEESQLTEEAEEFPSERSRLPDRYSVKEDQEVRSLSCLEAPNITVRIVRGKTVSESTARKAPERTIYLDGAAQCEPFMDHERQVYNLDHHDGVERSFTMATCEQALVLVRKGLNLSDKKWLIWANDPDLDTVLAIWILLNHMHLRKGDTPVYRAIVPLIRVEGIIDGLGLEYQDIVGLPKNQHKDVMQRIDFLREDERRIKSEGRWDEIDFATYTRKLLNRIDEMFFRPEDFKDFKGLEELARAELDANNSVIVYRSDMGIYEMEDYLNKVYGSRPAILLLRKGDGIYTIRKSDLFFPLEMERVYRFLNHDDPNVSGRNRENRWGGSQEIGGSPRMSGTGLHPSDIVRVIRKAYRKPPNTEKWGRILTGTAFPFLGGLIAYLIGQLISFVDSSLLSTAKELLISGFAPVAIAATFLIVFLQARSKPYLYGFRIPSGLDWMLLLPVIIASGLAGGVWSIGKGFADLYDWLALGVLLPAAMEGLFRTSIHGWLQEHHEIQESGGRWFLSVPVLVSGFSYAAMLALSPLPLLALPAAWLGPWYPVLQGGGAFLFGITAGMIRERSESIWPTMLIQVGLCLIIHSFY